MSTCLADHRPYDHSEAMPARTVANILDTHSHATREATDGTLLVWEEATIDGRDASAWIPAPMTACALAAWLGY